MFGSVVKKMPFIDNFIFSPGGFFCAILLEGII